MRLVLWLPAAAAAAALLGPQLSTLHLALSSPLAGPHRPLLASVRGVATDQEGTVIVLQRWLSQTGQEAAFREWLAAEALASSVHIESVLDWILSLCVHPAAARGPAPFVAREQSYKAALPFVLIAFAVTLLSPSGGEAQPRPAAAPAGAAPLAMVARRKTHPFREGASLKAPGAG